MIVAFFGHREIYETERVCAWVDNMVEKLVVHKPLIFFHGGYGTFDHIAEHILWRKKEKYSHIRSCLISAYPNLSKDHPLCDEIIYPGLESVPQRYAITYRNRYMAEQADIILAYQTHAWGGASAAISYARKLQKTVIVFPDTIP